MLVKHYSDWTSFITQIAPRAHILLLTVAK